MRNIKTFRNNNNNNTRSNLFQNRENSLKQTNILFRLYQFDGWWRDVAWINYSCEENGRDGDGNDEATIWSIRFEHFYRDSLQHPAIRTRSNKKRTTRSLRAQTSYRERRRELSLNLFRKIVLKVARKYASPPRQWLFSSISHFNNLLEQSRILVVIQTCKNLKMYKI